MMFVHSMFECQLSDANRSVQVYVYCGLNLRHNLVWVTRTDKKCLTRLSKYKRLILIESRFNTAKRRFCNNTVFSFWVSDVSEHRTKLSDMEMIPTSFSGLSLILFRAEQLLYSDDFYPLYRCNLLHRVVPRVWLDLSLHFWSTRNYLNVLKRRFNLFSYQCK